MRRPLLKENNNKTQYSKNSRSHFSQQITEPREVTTILELFLNFNDLIRIKLEPALQCMLKLHSLKFLYENRYEIKVDTQF